GPEYGVRDGDVKLYLLGALRDGVLDGRLTISADDIQPDVQVAWGRIQKCDADLDAVLSDVRRDVQQADGRIAACLEVGRLPDAACRSVALLPLELEILFGVVYPDPQLVPATGLRVRRQLEFEGRVAALVRAELVSIQPHRRAPVGGSDHQKYAAARPVARDLDRPAIPSHVALIRHPGERCAPGERNEDGLRVADVDILPLDGFRIKDEVPRPIQADPVRAPKIWPW